MNIPELIASGALVISMLAYLQASSSARKQNAIFKFLIDIELFEDDVTGLFGLFIGRVINLGQAPIKLEIMRVVYSDRTEEEFMFLTLFKESNNSDFALSRFDEFVVDYSVRGKYRDRVLNEYFLLNINDGKDIYISAPSDCQNKSKYIKKVYFYDVAGNQYKVTGIHTFYFLKKLKSLIGKK